VFIFHQKAHKSKRKGQIINPLKCGETETFVNGNNKQIKFPFHEEIRGKLTSVNACYRLDQNFVCFRLQSESLH
jgi:hypothetical protein